MEQKRFRSIKKRERMITIETWEAKVKTQMAKYCDRYCKIRAHPLKERSGKWQIRICSKHGKLMTVAWNELVG